MGRPRLIVAGLTASVAVLGLGTTIGRASPAAPTDLGPLRAWGGTQIRSLDPLSAAVTDLSRPRSSLPRSSGSPGSSGLIGSAPSASDVPRRPAREEVLSNESTFTRWAYVVTAEPIYAAPTATSNEDGFPEVYLLLRTHWDSHGREWVELRIPTRPDGRIGWVRRGALGALQLTHAQVVVNRRRLRMYVFQRGRLRWSAPVAVGSLSTPTPAGRLWIRGRFKIADRQSGYWPYAFGTSDYSTLTDWPGGGVVGINGPYRQPQAIPGRVSHGCIRLHTADDA